MGDKESVRDMVDAVKGVMETVPVYQDLLRPAAQQLGGALGTISQAVNKALFPLRALVWGVDQIETYVQERVSERLKDVSPSRIITPSSHVAGPALSALRFCGQDEELRDLFANLLATSIDAQTARNAHPAFVDIIRNMTSDEARIMRFMARVRHSPVVDVKISKSGQEGYQFGIRDFSVVGELAGCQHGELTPSYFDNLCRLGLLEIPSGIWLTEPNVYDVLEKHLKISAFRAEIQAVEGQSVSFTRKFIGVTTMGQQFCDACVLNKHPVSNA